MTDNEVKDVQTEDVAAPQEDVAEKVTTSLPDAPLVINGFDPENMTLDEAILFEPEGFTAKGFRQFLIDHSNWSRQEIGRVKIKDLKQVADALVKQLGELAVPNES